MPRVIRVELPEGTPGEWPYFRLHDGERVFERRWFADFQARWQRALRDEHWLYLARLEKAIE